jgi:hypothetical protein
MSIELSRNERYFPTPFSVTVKNRAFFFNKLEEIIYINDEIKVSSAQGVPRRATVRSQTVVIYEFKCLLYLIKEFTCQKY